MDGRQEGKTMGEPNELMPGLSRAGVNELKTCWDDFGYDGDLYGDPLSSLVGGFPDEWLEAVVLAGWVPNSCALPLAIRAYHLWLKEQMHECEGRGHDVAQ